MHFSLLEHGIYNQLLDWYYLDEQPLSKDNRTLFRRLSARTDEEQQAVLDVLAEMFVDTNDGWHHKRVDREITLYKAKSQQAREAGKLGGRPSKKGIGSENNRDGYENKADAKPTANREPLTVNQVDTVADESAPTSKRSAIGFRAYIDACKAAGTKPIPEDHPVRRYCAQAGIDEAMVHLAWRRFREEHLSGTRKTKRYIDWPAAFSNCVKDSWYGLWYVNADGPANWSPKGIAARKVADAEIAERQHQEQPND